ncbi:MAG: hypothetical protein U0T36_07795 [Saprospiraceae bacterium]
MRSIIFTISFLMCQCVFAQTAADSISPTFPKVLFINNADEILLYFNTKRQAYEVPSNGFIEGPIDFDQYIDSLAFDFGLKYDTYTLGGLFTYIYPNSYSTFIRPYFVVKIDDAQNTAPIKDLNCKWFSIEQTLNEIKYPASRKIVNQIMRHPEHVWTATFQEYGYTNPVDESKIKFKLISDFKKLH